MNKAQLRKEYLQARKQLSQQRFEELNEQLRNRLFPELTDQKGLAHVFLSIQSKKEVDTRPVLKWFWAKGWDTCTSITHFENNSLTHVLIDEKSSFVANKWGIPEPINARVVLPSEIDVVLIPMLCFDLKGHRVGYGKGYYDRFLSECRNDVVKIGLSIAEPVEEIRDAGIHDMAMDMCITPVQVYRFDKKNGRI